MPRYDIRNNGAGAYATFYCESCGREFRGAPSIGETIAKDVGRSVLGGFLREIPLVGWDAARNMEDSRYSSQLSMPQLDSAWQQMQQNFHECPTCGRVVCASDWDALGNTCVEDSPRRAEIARAQAEQVPGMVKGFASAFGLGAAFQNAGQVGQAAICSNCRSPVPPGSAFCMRCGTKVGVAAAPAVSQPTSCPQCGSPVAGKFCGACGSKVG